MAKRAKKPSEPPEQRSDVEPKGVPRPRIVRMMEEPEEADDVRNSPDDGGLSLEELGQAYAALLNRGSVPYDEPEVPAEEEIAADATTSDQDEEFEPLPPPEAPSVDAIEAACELSPRTILEAMLFVGHPQNEPLTAKQVASLMRGVLPEEIDEHIRELNAQYERERCPYTIASEGPGYRMVLRDAFAPLREQFYGRIKEARLSQAAVDTLAIVAYHQPVAQAMVDDFRGKPSGGLLSQLVRRQLVKIERLPENPKEVRYATTSRFLDLFGLDSPADLPRGQDFERME